METDDGHSLKLLDFFRIRDSVSGYCLSEEGRQLLAASLPMDDPVGVKALKADVALLLSHLKESEPPSLSFPEIASAVKTISKQGTVLEVAELFAVGTWARSYGAFSAFIGRAPGLLPPFPGKAASTEGKALSVAGKPARPGGLESLLAGAPDIARVAGIVFAVLTPDGELRDLPPLKKARDNILRANREIAALSDSFFRDPDLKSALQSGEPIFRDGRTLLAVRANFRGRVRGIVHEVSATGQTVFIEPAALVEKNNDLVRYEAEYRAEVLRILREATAALYPESGMLDLAREVLAGMDAVLARALHCLRGDLVLARDLDEGFRLYRGRHPLLGTRAVPINVDLPDGVRTLIVTGPNTGGKTVTLKTIGLFALMNQFGLGLPAAPETGFAVFDGVFADIGDEQSIDQSLSTFSGHMRVLGAITAKATARSLVLLDELGAGTDPEEGCAVAMGLLDYFIGKESLAVVTTHHGILKNYGYTRPRCLNASMDFDARSLTPTYRILMGVPGESRALDIAAQNGLSPSIVGLARRYLAEERTDVSELIRGLNEKHRSLDELERERRRRLKEAVEDQRKADLAGLRVRQKEIELRKKGVSDLQRLLGESRKTLENLVRELRESGAPAERTKEVKRFLADLAGAAEAQNESLERGMSAATAGPRGKASPGSGGPGQVGADAMLLGNGTGATGPDGTAAAEPGEAGGADFAPDAAAEGGLMPGQTVAVGSARRTGTLIRRAGKDRWLVQTGSLRVTVPERDLSRMRPAAPPAATAPDFMVELAPREEGRSARAAFELDLRGSRLSEALQSVEHQVDAASLQGLGLFSIIHGTGEGILGKGIHEYLRTHPAVADYHFARPEEGGYGKTVVRLK